LTDLPPSFAPVGFAWETLKDQGINRLRIAGAEELLGAGGALIDGTGRSRLKGARFLLTAQATRAQHTFETVIAAARMGGGAGGDAQQGLTRRRARHPLDRRSSG